MCSTSNWKRLLTASHSFNWDKTSKGHYHLKLCVAFICLVPVRRLLSKMVVLYHVNGQLQRAYLKVPLKLSSTEKSEYPAKNLLEKGREPETNSTRTLRQRRDLNTGPSAFTTSPPLLPMHAYAFLRAFERKGQCLSFFCQIN